MRRPSAHRGSVATEPHWKSSVQTPHSDRAAAVVWLGRCMEFGMVAASVPASAL